MKREMSIFAVMTAIMFLTMACSNEDDVVLPDTSNYTFQTDGGAPYRPIKTEPLSAMQFEKIVCGKGWNLVQGYGIKDDGSVDTERGTILEYMDFMERGIFISEDSIYTYNGGWDKAYPGFYSKEAYRYDEGTNALQNKDVPLLYILSYSQDSNILTVLEWTFIKFYQRMSEKELKKLQQACPKATD